MTKRYDEPIEVIPDPDDAPVAFSWRGKVYEVDERLTSWREAGEWWDRAAARDREYHRLLARPATSFTAGDVDADGFLRTGSVPGPAQVVFDVYLNRASGAWRLVRVWD